MRQRDNRRFKTALVTCRRIHVAKCRVRGCDTSPCASGNEGTVPARISGTEPVELCSNLFTPRIPTVVDMTRRHTLLSSEPRARIERTVRADGVGMVDVHVARAGMNAV